MGKDKIIFRADGNADTGLGHLYRLFALVEMAKDQFECIVITHSSSTFSILPESYNYELIPNELTVEEEADWLSSHYCPDEYILVCDGYGFGSQYQKKIKQKGYFLIYVDDLSSEYMYADVVINHSPRVTERDFKSEHYTQFALGPEYAILRPSFLKAIKRQRHFNTADKAFVCFGGADPRDLTSKVVRALLNIPDFREIHVVLGGAYRHESIFDLEKQYPGIKIHNNLNESSLVEVMQHCNYAVAPASTILYELCAVKMPVLSGYYVQNQEGIYEGCLESGIIYGGGNFREYSTEDFVQKILDSMDRKGTEEILRRQELFFDSGIQNRYLRMFSGIRYREAIREDSELLFEWANDKLARANSYNSDLIRWDEHQQWFSGMLKNDKAILNIAEIGNKPAGLIRFEMKEDFCIISVYVSEEFRGMGYAKQFIRDTSKRYFSRYSLPIRAYIKKENKASVKAFESADFQKFKEVEISGVSSYIYQLKKTC